MKKIIIVSLIKIFCLYFLPFGFLVGPAPSFAEAPKIIKFATIAPDNSTWANVLRDVDKELAEKSNGSLRLKIYAGGVQGDDKDVLRKMRIGQLHSASFMTTGLGQILPEARIFDLPFLFNKYDEIDFVKSRFSNHFSQAFDESGYILLGWTEVGFIYFFSNVPINSISDLQSTKMWMWEGDTLAKALFDSTNLSPIPLSIIDVTTSLQTGLIDSFYASPLAAIVFQWFTRTKYMLEVSFTNPTVAILITKKYYDKLSPDLQKILKDTFKNHESRLTQLIRKDNEESIEIIKDYGIKFVSPNKALLNEFKDIGITARQLLVGKLFTKELLEDVVNKLEEYKGKKAKGKIIP